ncbi:N-acetylglucosamine-6-phosphate deacetylase [Pedobacter sp. JCM 36344]|uniref:N-acetylglucosamine-6-phosphate deacetylase n=1 Tax=Pedobacter sp. JCM 36344 TaxID=3374280 RepID=UPI00397B1C96
MIAIINCKFFIDKMLLNNQTILIQEDVIVDVGNVSPPEDAEVIDAKGCFVTPGLLDLQIYGSGGNLFSAYPTAETLAQMDDDLSSKGTTGFLACVATNAPEIVAASIAAARAYRRHAKGFLGLHLEGPYLNPKRRGAHIEAYIKKATLEEVKLLIESAEGVVKMMTIAAELQDDDVLDYLQQQDVVLSLGHSDATFEQASLAYSRGFSTTTHLFNAMPSIHHRAPNLPVAVLNHDTAMASIIADGRHVDFEMVKLSHRLMGERLFLITDAVTTCNVGPYQHQLNGDKFITPDGTLSGSNITMLKAVQNCVSHCGISLPEALAMATINPARLMGIEEKYGSLSVGRIANLLFLDQNLSLQKVFVNGAEHLSTIN